MSGNVREWCWDRPDVIYGVDAVSNPRGGFSGIKRIYRGGGWLNSVENTCASKRLGGRPYECDNNTGFRLARTVE